MCIRDRVSMGNYLFNNEILVDALSVNAEKPESTHDFGRDILPELIGNQRVYAYDFRKNRVPIPSKGEEPSYWRDLGTIDAYYEAVSYTHLRAHETPEH